MDLQANGSMNIDEKLRKVTSYMWQSDELMRDIWSMPDIWLAISQAKQASEENKSTHHGWDGTHSLMLFAALSLAKIHHPIIRRAATYSPECWPMTSKDEACVTARKKVLSWCLGMSRNKWNSLGGLGSYSNQRHAARKTPTLGASWEVTSVIQCVKQWNW